MKEFYLKSYNFIYSKEQSLENIDLIFKSNDILQIRELVYIYSKYLFYGFNFKYINRRYKYAISSKIPKKLLNKWFEENEKVTI